jgi:hypothetical protein
MHLTLKKTQFEQDMYLHTPANIASGVTTDVCLPRSVAVQQTGGLQPLPGIMLRALKQPRATSKHCSEATTRSLFGWAPSMWSQR